MASNCGFLFPYNWDNSHKDHNNTPLPVRVCCLSLLAWDCSSSHRSAPPYSTTTTTHFREKHFFLCFCSAFICCVTFCLGYLISMWCIYTYIKIHIHINCVLNRFAALFPSQKCCLPNKLFSPLNIHISPSSQTLFRKMTNRGRSFPEWNATGRLFQIWITCGRLSPEVKGEQSAPCKQPTAQ